MTVRHPELSPILAAITRAWRTNRPEDLTGYLHPDITMALPGFQGSVKGREALVDSFKEFCDHARVIEYDETDETIHIVGDVAIASFHFAMIYERSACREHSTGRDIWAFERRDERWLAVWRTMTELHEERVPSP